MSFLLVITITVAALAIGLVAGYFTYRDLWTIKTGQTSVCGSDCDVKPLVRVNTCQDCRDHVKTLYHANMFDFDPAVAAPSPNCWPKFVDALSTTVNASSVDTATSASNPKSTTCICKPGQKNSNGLFLPFLGVMRRWEGRATHSLLHIGRRGLGRVEVVVVRSLAFVGASGGPKAAFSVRGLVELVGRHLLHRRGRYAFQDELRYAIPVIDLKVNV
jgi:hypothetical protein